MPKKNQTKTTQTHPRSKSSVAAASLKLQVQQNNSSSQLAYLEWQGRVASATTLARLGEIREGILHDGSLTRRQQAALLSAAAKHILHDSALQRRVMEKNKDHKAERREAQQIALNKGMAKPTPQMQLRMMQFVGRLMAQQAEAFFSSPTYRAFYASAGGAANLRVPRPTFPSTGSRHRYVIMHAVTDVAYYALSPNAAGNGVLILLDPFQNGTTAVNGVNNCPIRITNTVGAAGTLFTNMDWTAFGCLVDRAYITDVVARAPWGGSMQPASVFEDATTWSSEISGEAATSVPPKSYGQLLASECELSVSTAWDTGADVYINASGSNRHGPTTHGERSIAMNATSATNVIESEFNRPYTFAAPAAPTAATPQQIAQTALPVNVPGNETKVFKLHAISTGSWCRFGHLAIADSATGTRGSVSAGFSPRDNIPWCAQYGQAVIFSRGNVASQITIRVSMKATFAVIFPPDDGFRGASQLATALHQQAKLIDFNPNVPSTHVKGAIAASSSGSAHATNTAVISQACGTAVKLEPKSDTPSVVHDLEEQAMGAGGVIIGPKVLNAVKPAASTALEGIGAFAKNVGTGVADFAEGYVAPALESVAMSAIKLLPFAA